MTTKGKADSQLVLICSAGRTASGVVYLVMHTCLLPPCNPETTQASTARPAELQGQGSLQMHNISAQWPLSARRCCCCCCCCSAASGDEMIMQSMRRIPNAPANEDHTLTMSLLSVYYMILPPSPPNSSSPSQGHPSNPLRCHHRTSCLVIIFLA